MATVANLNVRLAMDSSDFDRGIKSAASTSESFVNKMGKLGGAMTAGLTLPILGIASASVAMANSLNKSMANVASLGVPTKRVNELKDSVQDLSIETGQATSEIAEGLYQVVSAFGDTADTAKILRTNVKLAKSGLATAAEAIALTSAVTKGYNDTSAEMVEHVADLSIKTVALGQTTLPELAGAIGTVTPLAGSLGIEMEDLFAVMATGAGVTGTASGVSTQFRGILQSLMAPTASMTKLIEDMGYANAEAMLEAEGLQKTIEAIVGASESTGKPLTDFIGSIEGVTLAQSLAGAQAETFTRNMAAMQDVAGAADEAFLAQTEGLNKVGFSMEQLTRYAEVLGQKLGDALAPALAIVLDKIQPLADDLIELVDQFVKMDSTTQGWILLGVGLVAALGPLLLILPGIAKGVSMLAGAVALMTGPVGLLIAAVVLLGFAWANNWGGIQEKTAAAWEVIKPILTTMAEKLLELTKNNEFFPTLQPIKVTFVPGIENLYGANFFWEGGYLMFNSKGNLIGISQEGFLGTGSGLNWTAAEGFWIDIEGRTVFTFTEEDLATSLKLKQAYFDLYPITVKLWGEFSTDFWAAMARDAASLQKQFDNIVIVAKWSEGTLATARLLLEAAIETALIISAWWGKDVLLMNRAAQVDALEKALSIFAEWGQGVLADLWDNITSFFSGKTISLGTTFSTSKAGKPGEFVDINPPFPEYVPGRAFGGPVSAGVPYIVGERGAEMFIPNRSGQVIPSDELGGWAGMGGGGGAGVVLNNYGDLVSPIDLQALAYAVSQYQSRRG